MPGFYISDLSNQTELGLSVCCQGIKDGLSCDAYMIKRCTLPKFLKDKCFVSNEQFVIVSEGVILNKASLFSEYDADTVDALIQRMFDASGERFFEQFRGSFSGALYIKSEKKWIVYTNHYGDSMVFYSLTQGNIVISSQVDWIINALRANGRQLSVDRHAVHSMLTYGYMSQDRTYANEIKRLYPGHYVVYKDGSLSVRRYYSVKQKKNKASDKTEDEIIDRLDGLFRKAVVLEYDKDREYGYRHLAQLSGGLDSRMSLWVAHDMGYKDILCMTFAQSGSPDETIAKQIAGDLGLYHIDWQLDTARHLFSIDRYVSMNFGLALYGGIGAEKEILDTLDTSRTGIVHTGQIGDVVIGCFLADEKELGDMSPGGTYSELLAPEEIDTSQFSDREEYLMFVRGFMGCLSSHLYARNYTEVASPFLNVELLEYCMSIPVEIRKGHQLYKKWIMQKYPGAAKYIWERIGKTIDKKDKTFADKIKKAAKNPSLVLKKLGLRVKTDTGVRNGMNPVDLWWETNKEFRDTYDSYFSSMILTEKLAEDQRKAIKKIYSSGGAIEKMLCITVLASIKLYFG